MAFQGARPTRGDRGRVLGIRYLVQGTVTKHGDRVRITADLFQPRPASLWWESYDALAHILDVQKPWRSRSPPSSSRNWSRLEREAAVRRPPVNLGAWDCYQRGLFHLWGFTNAWPGRREAMFRRAIELDPGFARAHGALAYVKLQSLVQRDPASARPCWRKRCGDGRTAVALDDQDCMNCAWSAGSCASSTSIDEAVAYLEQAVWVNPSFAQAYFALGFTLIVSGRAREAFPISNGPSSSARAIRTWRRSMRSGRSAISRWATCGGRIFARKATRIPNANHWPFAGSGRPARPHGPAGGSTQSGWRSCLTEAHRASRSRPHDPSSSSAAMRHWSTATWKGCAGRASPTSSAGPPPACAGGGRGVMGLLE